MAEAVNPENDAGLFPNYGKDDTHKIWGHGHIINRHRLNGHEFWMGDGITQVDVIPESNDPDVNPLDSMYIYGGGTDLKVRKIIGNVDGYNFKFDVETAIGNPGAINTYFIMIAYDEDDDPQYAGSVEDVDFDVITALNKTIPGTYDGALVLGYADWNGVDTWSNIVVYPHYNTLAMRRLPPSWHTRQAGAFGNGQDGDLTVAAPASLTKDTYCRRVTISSSLTTAGYRLFASEYIWIKNGGSINRNGVQGNPGGGLSEQELGGSGSGGAGAVGVGNPGSSATPGTEESLGGDGGKGGDGNNAGGAKGDGTERDPIYNVPQGIMLEKKGNLYQGGSGGGGGGGDGAAAVGGGGASGGGIVLVSAPLIYIENGGFIRAQGGDGQPGSGPNTGGGGGGGGGAVILIMKKLEYTVAGNPLNVNGGLGGAGQNGSPANGDPGVTGQIIKIFLDEVNEVLN